MNLVASFVYAMQAGQVQSVLSVRLVTMVTTAMSALQDRMNPAKDMVIVYQLGKKILVSVTSGGPDSIVTPVTSDTMDLSVPNAPVS